MAQETGHTACPTGFGIICDLFILIDMYMTSDRFMLSCYENFK